MNMQMSLGPQIRQRQELRLSPEQRMRIESYLLVLRLDLIGSLRDEKYKPKAKCPKVECQRELTPIEIIKGFNDDPNDFTTCCTSCGHRFQELTPHL